MPTSADGPEMVDHPAYYGGKDNPYEVIAVLEAWDLELAKGFCWGSMIKYTQRAGRKDPATEVQDRQKAEWYANRLTTITARLNEQRRETPKRPKGRYFLDPQGNANVTAPDGSGWVFLEGKWEQILPAKTPKTDPVPLVELTGYCTDGLPMVGTYWMWHEHYIIRVTQLEPTDRLAHPRIWCKVVAGPPHSSPDEWWITRGRFSDNARFLPNYSPQLGGVGDE